MTRRARETVVAMLLLTLASPAWSQQYLIYTPRIVAPDEKEQPKDGVLVREVPVKKGDTLYGLSRKFSGHGSYYSQILLFNDIKNPNLIYAGKTLKVPVSKDQPGEAGASAPAKAATTEQSGDGGAKAAETNSQKATTQRKDAAKPLTELSLSDLKQLEHGKHKKKSARKKASAHASKRKASSARARAVAKQPDVIVAGKRSGEEEQQSSQAVDKTESQPVVAKSDTDQKLFEKAVRAYKQDDCRSALDLFDRFLAENPSSPMAADASLYKADCYLKLSSQ